MTTITKKQGRSFNHFARINVSWTAFGGGQTDGVSPDDIIPFSTQGFMLVNEGSGAVEYSFNGTDLHGEIASSGPTQGMLFQNRVACLIWFRLKAGNVGPTSITVQAWGTR